MTTKKDTKKTGFNASQYVTDYKKKNYTRHEVLLRQAEEDDLQAILRETGENFTAYTKRHIKADKEKQKKDA